MFFSIAIPCYEYRGMGVEVLEYSFSKMETQRFKDFDVVISDQSSDGKIEELCNLWNGTLNIKYFRNYNNVGSGAGNFNNAIKKSTGKYIKLLCQDDYLMDENSLLYTQQALEMSLFPNWLASAYYHTKDRIEFYRLHVPMMNEMIMIINSIGTPSGITIKNSPEIPLFDTNLKYCYDCDWYHRVRKTFGDNKTLFYPTIANYIWEESATNATTGEMILKEEHYILDKYKEDRL